MQNQRNDGVKTFYAKDMKAWRNWLAENWNKEKSVWLIIYHKNSETPSVYYDDAVDEGLCFGWIDSKPNKRDEQSYFQFFSQRNSKSNWSRKNKDKIERLMKEGRMAEPGLEMVRLAKETGTWDALNDVENLIIPPDMQVLFDQNPIALGNFQAFPPSVRRGILEWIFNAKRVDTREKRIQETVELAEQNIRANQYRQ
ncbi:MAG: YdeI/OmpD-associated family protein [Bacteroidetes bacterium]|nr:YdeI/OmpD-associated family protein [Bacteroidota bacterium]MCB0845186.1 YdeI/OmpD-associated family protein [Bacteroidota bacterium]